MSSKVLVQEGDKDVGELIKVILESAGHQVVLLRNVENLLQVASRYSPDLIIIDHVLRDDPILDLCNQARFNQATARTPILITSTSPRAKELLSISKADDLLEKPFDIGVLVEKVSNCISCK
ncbi:response regulator [Desertivirga brevis]|uniref:response regulator n=1 Tax=Desertivirga brevis TaxID=2810310 RepID=UPI001A97CE33|nr:response regulator [Pedobacter sp. SYSU D00873]